MSPQRSINFTNRRSTRGSLAVVLAAVVLLIIVGLGAFAVDISHNITVRTELQNATDSAALAGAQDYKDQATWSNVQTDALNMAQMNTADGRKVSNTSNDTTVTVLQDTPPNGPTNPGVLQIEASMKINNLFAKIFGHATDTITTVSTANYWNTVNGLEPNQLFPIAPSLDDATEGPALNTKHIGDDVLIALEPRNSPSGNAAWTSGNLTNPNTKLLSDMVGIALNINPPDASIITAELADGSAQIGLTEGLHNGVDLSGSAYAQSLISKPFVVMPVITGGKNYTNARTLMGFIAVKITSITTGPDALYLHGTLVKGLVKGTGGALPNAGNSDPNGILSTLSVGTTKLVQ